MLTNNFKSCISRMLCNSTDANYFPIISTSGDEMGLSAEYNIMQKPMNYCKSNVATIDSGTFLCVGTSDEPLTRNQINLIEYCNELECLTSKSYQFNVKEDQDYLYKITSLLTLPLDSTLESVTIKEIGLFYKNSNTLTCIINQQATICMFYREVLEQPITLRKGEVHNFSVEIKMNDYNNDGLVKIIPKMTDFNKPSGRVEASVNIINYPAYLAFDGKAYSIYDGWAVQTNVTDTSENYIQYESDRYFYPTEIRYGAHTRRQDHVGYFTYKFSEDGVTWDSLDTINLRQWKPKELGDSFFQTSSTHMSPIIYGTLVPKELRQKRYKFFRLDITGRNAYPNSHPILIEDLQIYGKFA